MLSFVSYYQHPYKFCVGCMLLIRAIACAALTKYGLPKFSFILSQKHSQLYVNSLLAPSEAETQASLAILSTSWDQIQNAITQPLFAMRMRRMADAAIRRQCIVPTSRL